MNGKETGAPRFAVKSTRLPIKRRDGTMPQKRPKSGSGSGGKSESKAQPVDDSMSAEKSEAAAKGTAPDSRPGSGAGMSSVSAQGPMATTPVPCGTAAHPEAAASVQPHPPAASQQLTPVLVSECQLQQVTAPPAARPPPVSVPATAADEGKERGAAQPASQSAAAAAPAAHTGPLAWSSAAAAAPQPVQPPAAGAKTVRGKSRRSPGGGSSGSSGEEGEVRRGRHGRGRGKDRKRSRTYSSTRSRSRSRSRSRERHRRSRSRHRSKGRRRDASREDKRRRSVSGERRIKQRRRSRSRDHSRGRGAADKDKERKRYQRRKERSRSRSRKASPHYPPPRPLSRYDDDYRPSQQLQEGYGGVSRHRGGLKDDRWQQQQEQQQQQRGWDAKHSDRERRGSPSAPQRDAKRLRHGAREELPRQKDAPPSPDASAHLARMFEVHNVAAPSPAADSSTSPPVASPSCAAAVMQLLRCAQATEQKFRRSVLHVWDKELAEIELLAYAAGMHATSARAKAEGEPFSGEGFLELLHQTTAVLPTDAEHPPPPAPLPTQLLDHPPPDPRTEYLREYAAAQAWCRRPLRLPAFAEAPTAAAEPADSGQSWSESPGKAKREAEASSQRKQDHVRQRASRQQAYAAAGSGDVLDAPGAPPHEDGYASSLLAARSLPAPAEEPLDVDEGFFVVQMPDGSQKQRGQYSSLVQLVHRGAVPAGWPAYRPTDGLWLPLQEGPLSLEDLRWRGADMLEHPRGKEVWSQAGAAVVSGEQALAWMRAEAQSCMDASVARTHPGVGRDALQARPLHEAAPSFAAASEQAAQALQLRQRAAGRPALWGGAPPANVVAAVQGAILQDKARLKQVTLGLLQSALRTVVERRHAGKSKQGPSHGKKH